MFQSWAWSWVWGSAEAAAHPGQVFPGLAHECHWPREGEGSPQMPQPDYITFFLSLYLLCTLKFWSQWFCDWLKQQKLILIMELWKDKSIKCKCKVNLVQHSPKYSYFTISVYSNHFNFLHNPCSYLHIWNQI